MQNKKRGESKKSVLILISVILILSINIVSAERLPTVGGDTDNWGTILNEYLTQIAGPNATTLNISDSAFFESGVNITGDLHMGGAITHNSPVLFRDGIRLQNSSGTKFFDIEIQGMNDHIETEAPTDLNGTLLFETWQILNPSNMQIAFWDSVNARPTLILSQGGSQRASIFDRSLMVGKTLGNATINTTYSLCQGFNLIDCNTSSTGADLGVEDDIEAKGSIYSQENINATGNFSLGQKITFALGEIIDNIVDGWITITGNLNVTGNATFNERVGIGTNSPEGALHIDPTNVPALRLDGSSTEGDIAFATGDNLQIGDWNEGTTTFTKIAQFLRFNTEARFDLTSGSEYTRLFFRESDGDFGIYYYNGASGTTKFRIDGVDGHFELNGGKVGIGTTTPDEILHLFGNNAALKLEDDSGNNATIKAGNSQLTIEADPDNAIASTDIVFKMDGSEVARFYQGGNFGIGTTPTGGDGQLSLGADSEEGCFRYNSNKDSLEFSHQCDNNFSLISDAGFYGSLKWDTTTNCRWSLATDGPPYQTYPADTQCDDNERTAYGLTTSNVSVGNAEGRLPQIKFDSMPAGTYSLKATGQFATDGATSSDCGWMFTTGSINSTHTGFAGSGAARSSTPEIDGILHVPTDLSATTITIFIAESGGSDTCDIIVTATDIEQAELEISVYYYPQYNSTTGADYAEWFEKENELILAGDLIGLNVETGKVRVWRYADPIIGIASNNPSVAGNYKPGIENTHALVGLVGQLDLNEPRIIIKESVVYSPDGQFIGYKLSNGKVFIK